MSINTTARPTERRESTGAATSSKVMPCLWFDDQAEEAMNYYLSIFKDSKIVNVVRDQTGTAGPRGKVLTVTFKIHGQEIMALNGGPQFNFTEAVSFFVSCETQEEVDELWKKLSQGGEEGQCGWLKDKYGLSWQIAPRVLGEMIQDKDQEKAKRVVEAMLQMKKIDIQSLKRAYDKQ